MEEVSDGSAQQLKKSLDSGKEVLQQSQDHARDSSNQGLDHVSYSSTYRYSERRQKMGPRKAKALNREGTRQPFRMDGEAGQNSGLEVITPAAFVCQPRYAKMSSPRFHCGH